MTTQADREHLSATRREAVDACHRYLTGHLDQLPYDTALANGWPLATGAVEGACRQLIADRLDLDTYWRFHAARENARLYPASDQQNYTLTA